VKPLSKEAIAERNRKHAIWKEKALLAALAEQYVPSIFSANMVMHSSDANVDLIAARSYEAAKALAKVVIANRAGSPE